MRSAARQQRALRGGASATTATLVAATAHTLAGGGAPPWWLVVAVILLAAPVAVLLVGRRLSIAGIAGAVATAQLILHAAFATIGTTAPAASAEGPHAGHGAALTAAPALAAPVHLHLDAGMIVAHLTAAAVTVVLLTRGEHVARRLARGVRRLLRRVLPPLSPPAVVVATPARRVLPRAFAPLSTVSRRGPPALAR